MTYTMSVLMIIVNGMRELGGAMTAPYKRFTIQKGKSLPITVKSATVDTISVAEEKPNYSRPAGLLTIKQPIK